MVETGVRGRHIERGGWGWIGSKDREGRRTDRPRVRGRGGVNERQEREGRS